jgi:hypothetical protein
MDKLEILRDRLVFLKGGGIIMRVGSTEDGETCKRSRIINLIYFALVEITHVF